jgi:hypothetical protein
MSKIDEDCDEYRDNIKKVIIKKQIWKTIN